MITRRHYERVISRGSFMKRINKLVFMVYIVFCFLSLIAFSNNKKNIIETDQSKKITILQLKDIHILQIIR